MAPGDIVRPAGGSQGALVDAARLAAVAVARSVTAGSSPTLDGLAGITARLLGTPVAFVTLVDEDVACWVGCAGADGRQNATSGSFCQYVIARDAPLLVDDARVDPLTASNPSIESMGVVAWAGHPIRDTRGRVLGTLCAVDTEPRHWSAEDDATLATLASLAGSEVQLRMLEGAARAANDRLDVMDAAIARAELRTRQLAELARRLSAATSTADIGAAIVQLGPDVFDASFANVATIDEEGASLLVLNRDGLPVDVEERYRRIPLHVATPLTDAVRSGSIVAIVDDEERMVRYPDLVKDTRAAGLTSTVAVPLMTASRGPVGVLGLGWAQRTELTATLLASIATTAEMCGQALERGGLADAREQFLRALQREMLPSVPSVPGLQIAARHVPARTEVGFGGDWFDVVPLDPSTTAIVIGDVCGHGVQAAARMAMIRGAIIASLRTDPSGLSTLLSRTEALLTHIPDRFVATVAVHVIDVAAGTMRFVSAGHPPAVVSDGRRAQVVEQGRRAVLGFGDVPCVPGEVPFPPGATLVVLTDGLIEDPHLPIDDGLALVARLVEDAADRTVEELATALIAIAPASHRDDVALLAVRRTAP